MKLVVDGPDRSPGDLREPEPHHEREGGVHRLVLGHAVVDLLLHRLDELLHVPDLPGDGLLVAHRPVPGHDHRLGVAQVERLAEARDPPASGRAALGVEVRVERVEDEVARMHEVLLGQADDRSLSRCRTGMRQR
ncbi:MAG: hypothetical protein R3B49_05415 [Phycisphaerales bacterium]